MTLLSIATNVLNKNKSTELPSTIIDNLNDTARLVFAAIEDATQYVLWAHVTGWQILMKSYTFDTVDGQQGYDLPSDILYNSIITDSFWNATTRYRVIGPVSPMQWQMNVNLLLIPTIIQQYIIMGNQLLLYPTPSADQSLNYLYLSENCIYSIDNSPQNDWEADSDYSILSEYAIELQASWRYLKQLGRPYEEEKQTADTFLQGLIDQDAARQTIYVNQQSLPPNIPLASYLAPISR
jgi:hypothetical protein